MVIETKTYEIYAGIGKSDDDVTLVDTVEMDSDLEARDYAELCAMGLYNLNPKRDIFEIMEQDGVDQNKAMEIFKKEAKESVVFFALEYDEDGTMTRHY
jgi:hypothetical protein